MRKALSPLRMLVPLTVLCLTACATVPPILNVPRSVLLISRRRILRSLSNGLMCSSVSRIQTTRN